MRWRLPGRWPRRGEASTEGRWAAGDSGTLCAASAPVGTCRTWNRPHDTALAEVPRTYFPAALPAMCRVHVRNVYFEATPLDLFAGVVTERGRVEVAGIAAAVEALRETYCLAFQLALPEE